MCKLVAAGHGDALSHLLARRGVLFVVLLHVATLFGRVHLVPAEVSDLCGDSLRSMAFGRRDFYDATTPAATTTPREVAIPASFKSDLRTGTPMVTDVFVLGRTTHTGSVP